MIKTSLKKLELVEENASKKLKENLDYLEKEMDYELACSYID